MNIYSKIEIALSKKTTSAYVWLLAYILLFGTHAHISNMLGWSGKPWSESPMLWRILDVVLLAFNLAVAAGLIMRKAIAVIGFIAGIVLLQIVPYTIFRSYFVMRPDDHGILNSLVGAEIILILIMLMLVFLQGKSQEGDNII